MSKTKWTEAHVRRLFWRAGFGATPKEARTYAKRGREASYAYILNGRGRGLRGPEPTVDGKPLDPVNEYSHDVLWWLDRMVRTERPLVEKMTLFWHDHFATNDQDTPLMLGQNHMFRRYALAKFPALLRATTLDPALQMFLSLPDSDKDHPNENFSRELMELFTLASGYTEDDIREGARALTGFEAHYNDDGFQGITYDKERHDGGVKRIFKQRGRFDWQDVLALCVAHPAHAPFMVGKLWEYFVSFPPAKSTRRELARTYRASNLSIKPVVAQILRHPALYANLDQPAMVKAPAVLVAGALRTTGGGIRDNAPEWLMSSMGQRLFDPPSVAGWEWGPAWMSSNTMRVRFDWGNFLLGEHGTIGVGDEEVMPIDPVKALDRAHLATGRPPLTASMRARLLQLGREVNALLHEDADDDERNDRARLLQRSLRHALVTNPEYQLH